MLISEKNSALNSATQTGPSTYVNPLSPAAACRSPAPDRPRTGRPADGRARRHRRPPRRRPPRRRRCRCHSPPRRPRCRSSPQRLLVPALPALVPLSSSPTLPVEPPSTRQPQRRWRLRPALRLERVVAAATAVRRDEHDQETTSEYLIFISKCLQAPPDGVPIGRAHHRQLASRRKGRGDRAAQRLDRALRAGQGPARHGCAVNGGGSEEATGGPRR